MLKEAPYWMALAHLRGWRIERINNLVIDILVNHEMTFPDFFDMDENEWENVYSINEKEAASLIEAKSQLANYSFLAESMNEQGIDIIPMNSDEYSKVMKENLKIKSSPPILYVKGFKGLMNEECVAVVGSRTAGDTALKFTENLSIELAKNFKVVVSGFAKGVDKMALDSSIKNNGNSIIVLPQGILTFSSGFKKYYPQLVEGQILVISTFPPNIPWNVRLAMARNTYIYGLANEIYVAESNETGGTWNGALDGLKKGRKVYVRIPEEGEKNANNLLIEKGGIPIDFEGKIIEQEVKTETIPVEKDKKFKKNDEQLNMFN
ncbi:MAG: DNA-processing protein DprA [Ignavibacteriae bacterium]|nr:MAG: DNA-processing protein DprA [Ignavibacteriota bacterium]